MAGLSATTRIRVTPDPGYQQLELVQEPDSPGTFIQAADYLIPWFQVFKWYAWSGATGRIAPEKAHDFVCENWDLLLAVKEQGVVNLRLYCPERISRTARFFAGNEAEELPGDGEVDTTSWDRPGGGPTIQALPDEPSRSKPRYTPIFRWGTPRPKSYGEVRDSGCVKQADGYHTNDDLLAGTTIELLGRRATYLTEVVTFAGETEKHLKYGYDSPPSELLFAGTFFDAEGIERPHPRPVAGNAGLLKNDRPLWGSMTVGYIARYDLIRVRYGLGLSGNALFAAKRDWLLGYWTTPPKIPSLRIFAVVGGQTLSLTVERKVWPATAAPLYYGSSSSNMIPPDGLSDAEREAWERDQENKQKRRFLLTGQYQEISRETALQRITSPDDPDVYVDVERITSATFQGPDGEEYMLRFNTWGT